MIKSLVITFLLLTCISCASVVPQQNESVRLLSASHVAIVVINDFSEGQQHWRDFDITVVKEIKGAWRQRVLIAVPEGAGGLARRGTYLVFSSENATSEKGVFLYANWEDVIQLRPDDVPQV